MWDTYFQLFRSCCVCAAGRTIGFSERICLREITLAGCSGTRCSAIALGLMIVDVNVITFIPRSSGGCVDVRRVLMITSPGIVRLAPRLTLAGPRPRCPSAANARARRTGKYWHVLDRRTRATRSFRRLVSD